MQFAFFRDNSGFCKRNELSEKKADTSEQAEDCETRTSLASHRRS